jgi:hypothetical protein
LNKISKNLIKKLDSSEYTCVKLKTNDVNKQTAPKEPKILHRLFKILKCLTEKMEQDKLRYSDQEILTVEWKELARRIEYIFLILAFLIVILTPILLFGKFFLRDFITFEHLKAPCGCQNSFVKSL